MSKRRKHQHHKPRAPHRGRVTETHRSPPPPGSEPASDADFEEAAANLVAALLAGFGSDVASGDRPALTAELWLNDLLAGFGEPGTEREVTPEMWADVAAALEASKDPLALALRRGLAAMLPAEKAQPFRRLSLTAVPAGVPAWAAAVGTAQPVQAMLIGHPTGDGTNLCVDFAHDSDPHAVAVLIDHNLGDMAKDLLIGPPLDELVEVHRADPDADFTFTEIGLADARAWFEAAMWLTDHTIEAPVNEGFDEMRDLIEARFALLPEGGSAPEHEAIEQAEADRLVAEFLDSDHAGGLSPAAKAEADGIAHLWLDHATGYTTGAPLRVSPVLVELFMVSWFPRKVMADKAMTDAVPEVVASWLAFAAERTGLAQRWLDEALAVVDEEAGTMAEAMDDPGAWGMGKSMLSGRGPGPLPGADDGWVPLAPDGDPDVDDWAPDLRGVPDQRMGKVSLIAGQVVERAGDLLGPAWIPDAVEVVIRLGRLADDPFANTQVRSWSGGVVWLLAEDADAFERVAGRRKQDLAEAMEMSADTYRKKAARIRELLGLEAGELG